MGKSGHKKDDLRQLASDAKMRLTHGYWENIKAERTAALEQACLDGKDPQRVMMYFSERCSREIAAMRNPIDRREEELYQRVKQILERDGDLVNPVATLADQKYMSGLTDTERQRYVFSLMGKYSEMKRRYERECKLLDGIEIKHLSR